MKEKGIRVFVLVMAVLFLVTSLGFSGLVIWQMVKDRHQNQQNTGQQQQTGLQGTPLSNFTPVAKVEQLQSTDLKPGTGAEVKPGDTITAHYTGAIAANGIIFQSSHDNSNQPVSFSLGSVIRGWAVGVPGMKVGGTRRLLIPANLAYGANPPAGSGIPPNADLVFDIELVKIGQ